MVPKYYEFCNKIKIVSGFRSLENTALELKKLKVNNPLILTDAHPDTREARLFLNILKQTEIKTDNLVQANEKTQKDIERTASDFVSGKYDSVIALGSDMAFDVSRAMYTIGPENSLYIAVPMRFSITGTIGQPDIVILDPRMIVKQPSKDTVAQAMEILSHCIDAYTCMKKNPISDAYALTAITLVRDNLPKVLKKAWNRDARLALANAWIFSDIASTGTKGGVAQIIANVLEERFRTSHGYAMGIVLPHFMEHNMIIFDQYYGELLFPLAGPEIYSDTAKHERGRKALVYLKNMLKEYHELYDLPICLSDIGMKRSDMNDIASQIIARCALLKDYKEVKVEDILNILNLAY